MAHFGRRFWQPLPQATTTAMSRRLHRRQQRQLEELDELQNALTGKLDANTEQENGMRDSRSTASSAFAALSLDQPDDDGQDDAGGVDAGEQAVMQTQGGSKKSKKNNKKKKKGASQQPSSTHVDDISLEEMTDVIAKSTQQFKVMPDTAQDSDTAGATCKNSLPSALRALLALDSSHLDPAHELRRQFGASAIKAYEREKGSSTTSGRTGARNRDNRGAHLNSNMRVRTVLTTPKPTWPDLNRSFVGMSMSANETDQGVRVYSWEHSRAYKQAQFQFSQAVASFDTQSLVALLRVFPWHIDTLLQLSAVSRYQGDLGQASDFIDRALFAMERSAASTFVSGLTSHTGPPICDFLRAENRAFWLAVHRNIDLYGRKGTWRTALEWCKLLFALDTSDPHGILLWVDFLAIKSRQERWLLEFTDVLQELYGILSWSIGLSYARALALRVVDTTQADQALASAMIRHPHAAILLADKLQVDVPADVVRSFPMHGAYSSTQPALNELLAHLYVHRSLSVWKEANTLAWFRMVSTQTWQSLDATAYRESLPENATRMGLYRHLVVADLPEAQQRQLLRYVPPEIRNPPGGIDTFDPLPPSNGTRFDEAYYGSVLPAMTQRGGGPHSGLWELLQRLQNLGVHDVQQLLEHVDDRTRDLLMQVVEPVPADEAEEEATTSLDDIDGVDDETREGDVEHTTGDQPSLLQRAWNALWGA